MTKIQLSKRGLSYDWQPSPNKQVLVLTHALGMNLHAWQPIKKRLAEHFSLLSWDLPGHGGSDAIEMDETITPQGLVQELVELTEYLNIKQFSHVGTSIGGVVGLAMLQTQSELIQGMVLTNTGAVIGQGDVWYERCKHIRQRTLQAMAQEIVPRWFSAESIEQSRGALLPHWQHALATTDQLSYIKLCEMLAVTDLRQVKTSGVPVSLIGGRDDVATPPSLLMALSEQLGVSEPDILAQVGHIPAIETPELFTDILLSELL